MRYALLLSYDGTDFAGWWRQAGQLDHRTVAGELDAAFRRLGEHDAAPVGASRTDAGVHALGQVAHVDVKRAWEPRELVRALDRHLPLDCACLAAASVADDWHAAHHARGKTYRYALDVGATHDPLGAHFAWRPPFAPELTRLNEAAAVITVGKKWRAFRRRGEHREEWPQRRLRARWQRLDNLLICRITGEGFTYRLVRSLVGGMVAVAHGGCSMADWKRAVIDDDVTPAAAQQAPAHGLRLESISYRDEPQWQRL